MDDQHGYYRAHQETRDWPNVPAEIVGEIPRYIDCVNFTREKNSHRGIGQNRHLRKLCAGGVNQDFLEEICKLDRLHALVLCNVTADDLSPLTNLQQLISVRIHSPRNATDFTFYKGMPGLRFLFIEHAKHLTSLDPFASAHQLTSLGVEGSTWTKQKIPSLLPISLLDNLEALFLSSVQLEDKDLSCLVSLPKLKLLSCARFAPQESFKMLRALMPDLQCDWCDEYETHYEKNTLG